MYDNIVFRTFVKITYCDKAFLIKDYHHHHHQLDAKTGDVCGFPKLKNCGGFELMHCVANCRTLSVIECASSVRELKANVGNQPKIYLRPIQKDLSTAPVRCGRECFRSDRKVSWLWSGCLGTKIEKTYLDLFSTASHGE